MILDGYNVINSWPELKFLMDESLDTARNALINIMAEYKAFKGINVIIVFDAYLVKENIRNREKSDKLEVKIVFTKEKETADSYIERLIIELSEKNMVAVVTNDKVEQQMVLGSGAIRVPVREMVEDFKQAKYDIDKKIEIKKIQKNTLSDLIDSSILEKLERLRRGKKRN